MNKVIVAGTVLAVLIAFGGMSSAATVFDDGATDPLGQYRSNETLNIAFFAPLGSAAISFDLFGALSVDGAGNSYTDTFDVAVNGTTVFSGNFNMSGGGANVVMLNTFGWIWSTVTNGTGLDDWYQGGVTSVSGVVGLLAGRNTFSVTFSGGQVLTDESWALNDLVIEGVSPVPVPAAFPMLALGLAGLGAVGLNRRKAKRA